MKEIKDDMHLYYSNRKEIKDHLHLYGIDCPIMTPDGLGTVLVIYPNVVEVSLKVIQYHQVMKGRKGGGEMHYKYFYTDDIKLAVRPLSDMTEEEKVWMDDHDEFREKFLQDAESELLIEWRAEQTQYLLSKHFDLFALIESGLAIDKTTLK